MTQELELLENGKFYPDPPRNDSSLGRSLFFDPLAPRQSSLGDMRQRLELKAAACAATGGFNGYPLDVNRIRNTKLRAIVGAGMTRLNWSVQDLIACSGGLEGAADSALIATLENPRWGPEDFRLFGLIERLEEMQNRALGGTATL